MKDETLEALGKLIDSDMSRDAVHIAVVPAIAGSRRLIPGDHVGLTDGLATLESIPVGVVDPYLRVRTVEPGQKFWLFLYPGTLTSLKHVWTHPAIPNEEPVKIASRRWLEEWCGRKYGRTFDASFIEDANAFADGEIDQAIEDWDEQDKTTAAEIAEFWRHFSIVTGRTSVPTMLFRSCCI